MKISKRHLRRIIKEEKQKLLREVDEDEQIEIDGQQAQEKINRATAALEQAVKDIAEASEVLGRKRSGYYVYGRTGDVQSFVQSAVREIKKALGTVQHYGVDVALQETDKQPKENPNMLRVGDLDKDKQDKGPYGFKSAKKKKKK